MTRSYMSSCSGCAGSARGTLTQADSRFPVPLVGLVGDRGIARKIVLGQYPYGLEGRPGG